MIVIVQPLLIRRPAAQIPSYSGGTLGTVLKVPFAIIWDLELLEPSPKFRRPQSSNPVIF